MFKALPFAFNSADVTHFHAPQRYKKIYKAKTTSLVNLRKQSLAHILFNLPSSCRINLRGEKKNATIYSCLPPLLLHWSSGSLSDLLKGTDQNNCSVQKNMTHSSPRTVWWLQSNSGFFFFLQMTDGTCGLSLTSPFFRLRGRDSFDLILICLRYTKGITNVTIQLSNIPWEAGTALSGTWGLLLQSHSP